MDISSPYISLPSIPAKQAAQYFAKLRHELQWVRVAPRSEYYCSKHGAPYTYGSGAGVRTYQSQLLTDELAELFTLAESSAKCKFDVVFLNMYENERDHLGWHSDNSPEMDDARPILIISLGATREIYFKPIGGSPSSQQRVLLEHGSQLLMQPGMQDTHLHKIPKGSRACGSRISLTFRGIADGY